MSNVLTHFLNKGPFSYCFSCFCFLSFFVCVIPLCRVQLALSGRLRRLSRYSFLQEQICRAAVTACSSSICSWFFTDVVVLRLFFFKLTDQYLFLARGTRPKCLVLKCNLILEYCYVPTSNISTVCRGKNRNAWKCYTHAPHSSLLCPCLSKRGRPAVTHKLSY